VLHELSVKADGQGFSQQTSIYIVTRNRVLEIKYVNFKSIKIHILLWFELLPAVPLALPELAATTFGSLSELSSSSSSDEEHSISSLSFTSGSGG